MATEADIGETILLKEKCLNPGELIQPPQTVDYLVKSGVVEVASIVEVEIVNSSFEGNAGMTAGESFSESPLIAKVPDQQINKNQETCQANEISHQAEKTMPEEKQTEKEAIFNTTEVTITKGHEVVDEISLQSDDMGISSKMENIEEPHLEVSKEDTSKGEILVSQVEVDKQGSVEENQMEIGKETIALQKEGREEDSDAELKASNGAAAVEASTGLNEEPSVLGSDLTVHLDTDVEKSKQPSLKNEHEDNAGYAEAIFIEENNTERISEGVQAEETDSYSVVLDEETSPDVAKPIECKRKKKDISHDSIREASSIPETSLEIQSNNQDNSASMENAKDKLDSPLVTLATDGSSLQEETSNVANTEESQYATNLNANAEISSDLQTKESSLLEVERREISMMALEILPDDCVKGDPQEPLIEALAIKTEADSCGGDKVMDETTSEGKLDSFVKHEGGEKNIDEKITTSDAPALDNRDVDRNAAIAGEEIISQAVTAPENNQEESGKEKNLSSLELNQKIETAEAEFHGKNSSEAQLLEQETIVAESKELGQDSDLEPQGQLDEESGDRHDERKSGNDSQACERTENTANGVVTTEQSSETSEIEIKKLEKVNELGSQDRSEIKDGGMNKKEEACETEKHKSEITGDDITTCHTEESGFELVSSTDSIQETTEQNFQARSLHEGATILKGEEVEKIRTTNDEITGIEKITDEEVIQANVTNLSSEVIKEETVESSQQIDNPSRREMLLEPETAEIVDSIGNEAKRSDEVPDLALQSSLAEAPDFLESENLITSEGSSAESHMTNDKENHTNPPQAETGEHNEKLKDVECLEQIMQKNGDKENIEQPLNIVSAETEGTLSQSDANTVQERDDLPQEVEREAETEKVENFTIGSSLGSALQESVDEDHVIFQKNESCIHKSNAEITGESVAAATCENTASETTQNVECPVETFTTSLADTTAAALVDVDNNGHEIPKEENLLSRELNEKIEITEGETLDKKLNELNVTHSMEKELGEVTNFENQEQVHEVNGGDEVKNDEPESKACKDTENTDSEHPTAEETENTETSEAELEALEKVHESETSLDVYCKEGPQETMIEALAIKPEADSCGGEKVIDETATEGKLDSFMKHEDGEKNIEEIITILDASALDNRDEDRDVSVAGEEIISQALTAAQNNQEESGKEKSLSSTELNQKIETAEVEFHDKTSSKAHLLEQETVLVACESIENTANGAVTTEQSAETSENEIEKLEKVHELGSQDQSEIKDGEMSIKEEACETEKHKSEITGDDITTCHTEESGSEIISSTDSVQETLERNFHAGTLHEAATTFNGEEVEKTRTTNDEITGSVKVTDEEVIQANVTNLSSEVINEETVESSQEIDKEVDVSIREETKEQIVEGTSTAYISPEAIEEAAVKNFGNNENKIDNEMLLEQETAETVDSLVNEAKQSDEVPDLAPQSSLVKARDFLQSENLIMSEGSSAEIHMTNDKENHTDPPQAETGEHKEILKGVEYLEQIMQKNEDKESIVQPFNVISTEVEGALSQSDANTVQERDDLPQEVEREAETEKEENFTIGSSLGSALQESVDEDPVIFQKNESCIDKSNAEITGESVAAATCENIASETILNAECPTETIPTSLADTTAAALVDFDDIGDEILKEENLPSRELNEKIEITEGETLDKKVNELNVTQSLEEELREVTDFDNQEQVCEVKGGDEVKNDEKESQTCKGTENTDSEHPTAEETEKTETSEAELQALEKVHESEPMEEVENKDAQISIKENVGNEEDVQKLETSDATDKYHAEEVSNHKKIEQNFQAEGTSTTLEGVENNVQIISVIDKEITGVNEVNDKENINEDSTQLSLEETSRETAENSQQAEKEGDKTTGENTEENIILQKSLEGEPIENFQSYEKNSDKPSSRQNLDESETASIADEAKQTNTSPESTPQSSLIAEHGSSQSENHTIFDDSTAEEISVDESSIKEADNKENYNEQTEGGGHSKELLEGEVNTEQTLQKDNVEQPLPMISLDTETEALSQIDNITVKETAQSPQENEERDEGREKEDMVLLKGEEDAEQILHNDNVGLETLAEASSQTDKNAVKETAESPQENEKSDAGREKEDGINESNSKSLQLESVAQSSVKDFENDDRVEKSNKEILEESEAAERGENTMHEANQSNETPNATIPSPRVKEAESLQFEDKGVSEESSPEEKKDEGFSITSLEEDIKEIDKHESEPVHFALETEESLNSSLQTSTENAEQTLQEEPQEKMEQSLNNIEETVVRPQDSEGDEVKEKQADIVNESNNESLPLEHVAQDLVKNFKNDGDAEEKPDTEILEQPKAVESIENITYETDQNDSHNAITPTTLAVDVEYLHYEDKDIAVEASAEELKEEPSSVKNGEDNRDSITMIEENNNEGDQETSKTCDFSAHEMMLNEESLSSSTQASLEREEETPGSDNLTLVEASTKEDEDKENYTGLIEVREHKKELLEEDAKEILQKVAQDPVKNFKHDDDDDGTEKSKKEILEQSKAEESENITDESNRNESPNATNPEAPVEDVESLHCEDKDIAMEASAEEKKEEASSIKTSEDSSGNITMIEENNKESDQEISKTDDYFSHEMTQNEESLNSSIQTSLPNKEEILGNDNLTPVEASIKKYEEKESYTPQREFEEHNKEFTGKEEDAQQILHKDEPEENIKEPLDVTSMETEEEALSELKETVESPQDNEKRDGGEKEDVIDESKIKSLPLESVAQTPVEHFENDDPMEKIIQSFQDNAKNTETLEEEDDLKEHIVDECDTKSISKEPVDQGTTKDLQNDEDNDEISIKEILEETAKGEMGESIALETNQNYEITNITIPTEPVKGESLQDGSEYVNLEEPSLEVKKEDDGSSAKASQVNGSNFELAEAIMLSEAERSHGEENIEPKSQNEPEEFLKSSADVITQESEVAILDKKADEISILEEVKTVPNNEKTEEEGRENEDCDGSKLNDVSTSEDIKPTAETYYANEVVEEKSVTILMDLETTKAHVSDYSKKVDGEHKIENKEEEMNEDSIIKFQGVYTACMNENTEKHVTMEEHLSRDILPQPAEEETNLIQENKEIAQIEMHEEFELTSIVEDTTRQVLDDVSIAKDQCTEPTTLAPDDMDEMVPKTEMHATIQADVENCNTGEQIMQKGKEIESILDDNLKESSSLPSTNSGLMTGEESKPMDNNSAKEPAIHENIETELISQVTELAHNEDKITTAKEISELAIEDIGKVKTNEEAGSYESTDLNQDLELHNEKYQVDEQEISKTETSKDEESSNVGDEALNCTESTNAEKEKSILNELGVANESEASVKEIDAAEKATDEHEAENIDQVDVTSESKSSGVPAEENLESAEPRITFDHTSEILSRDQSNETIPETSLLNKIYESVEQRSQGSPGILQEKEEKTESYFEVKHQINETRDVEDVAILTEENQVYKEVEKAQGDEIVEHFNKDGDDKKEFHSGSIGGEIIHEVKESALVSSEYHTTTDSNEQTETTSLEVREAQDMEEESSATKEDKVIKEQIMENAFIKEPITPEEKSEPRLEEVQTDEKLVLVSNIPLDASSSDAAETGAGQQDNMALEVNSSNMPSQLQIDDQGNLVLENVALENAAVDDFEERREIFYVYETKKHDERELHTGEVREEIKEAAETVNRSQEKETVTETGDVIDHNPPEEIRKEPEVPSQVLPCKEEDCQTESTVENIENYTEKVEMTKDKPLANSSALKTVEDRSLQIEMLDVSQMDLQEKKSMPGCPTEEHEEKGGTLCDTKEESEAASGTVLQSKCHSLKATEINEVADNQNLHNEKTEEQNQTEPCVLLSKDLELGSLTEIKKLEESMKEEELLEDEQRKSEEASLQKEESRELQVSAPHLEPRKDTEESSNETQKEVSVTSIEIGNKKEASEAKLDSNSKGNEAAKEDEEITPVQTNYTDKSQEENLMSSNPLLSKEQEGEASTTTGSIEEKTKEMQELEDEPKEIQDACLQKEKPEELKVPSYEFQPHVDEQESLKETHDREDGIINGVNEEIGEVSESVLKSSCQDYTAVSEDKITSSQPQPTEKLKEEDQTSVAGLVFEKQEHNILTIAESTKGKTTREEVPEIVQKTIEEVPLQKEEPREFKPSELALQVCDYIQNESQKKGHDAEDGMEESLELHSQHEIEKRNAEKMDLVAIENQGEKTTDAIEVVDTEVTNEQIMEKCDAKSSHAITLGEDATKESHQEHQQIIEETPGAKILENETQVEVLPEETAKVDQSATTEKQITAEKGPVEPLLQNATVKEHFLDETGEKIVEAAKELSRGNQYDKAITGDGRVDSMEREMPVETTRKEGAAGLVEATEIIQNIHQQEKTSDSTLKDKISGKKEPETMASTRKKEVPEVQKEQTVETTNITEVGDSQQNDENGKAIEETPSKEPATISLQEMLQAAKKESDEKEPTATKEEEKAKSDEEVIEEEEEQEEEDGEEGEEQKKNDSGSDGVVVVESSRDIEMKIAQKKSHNILSGVGSKVKHSIIKVKKAITGKSSHTKQHSPK